MKIKNCLIDILIKINNKLIIIYFFFNPKMYYISGGSIRLANKRFNSCNNEYEMTLDQNSNVTLVIIISKYLNLNIFFVKKIFF